MPFFTFQETILLKELAYGGARYFKRSLTRRKLPLSQGLSVEQVLVLRFYG